MTTYTHLHDTGTKTIWKQYELNITQNSTEKKWQENFCIFVLCQKNWFHKTRRITNDPLILNGSGIFIYIVRFKLKVLS